MVERGANPALEPADDTDAGAPEDRVDAADLDLACPGCGTDLARDDAFARFRVCPSCGRHFPVPARERLALLVDPGGFDETNAALLSVDPLVFHDNLPFPERLAEAQELMSPPGLAEGVITGLATIGGIPCVVVVLDLALLGGSIGVLAGEKITLALEQAAVERLPVIAVCASGRGPERAQEGMLALAQLAKISAAAANLRRSGVPLIAVLAHPTSGGVYVGLAGQADIVLAEPGARIGFTPGPDSSTADATGRAAYTAEALFAHGQLDAIVERPRLRETLSTLLDLVGNRGALRAGAVPRIVAESGPSQPRWEIGSLARHPDRPSASTYLDHLLPTFVELHGDRLAGDDRALICGLGRLSGVSVVVIAQDRGRSGDASRNRRGGITAQGLRKADRVMRLAGRLELPVLILVDGAAPAVGAEPAEGGIGLALSQALGRSSVLPVPTVTAILGESGGASVIALGLGDRTLMLEHAVVSVPSLDPGAVAARVAERAAGTGGSGRYLTARECQRLGVVDEVVPEPAPAAHADPEAAARLLGGAIAASFAELLGIGQRGLLASRSRRLRTLGMTTPEARAATRREALALLDIHIHDLPRHLARSIGEWRDRLESRYRAAPRLTRAHLQLRRSNLGARLSTFRANVAGGRGRVDAFRGEIGAGAESRTADDPITEADERPSISDDDIG